MAAAQTGFVIDITGHGGTRMRNVEVWMPHNLATASSVVHMHAASGYEITGCNLTHYSAACKPGYPVPPPIKVDPPLHNCLAPHPTEHGHDGPDHLGLCCDALPRASNGPDHLGLRCDALPKHQMALITSDCDAMRSPSIKWP